MRRHSPILLNAADDDAQRSDLAQLEQLQTELQGKVVPVNSAARQSTDQEPLPSLVLPRVEERSVAFGTSGYLVLGLCCAIATISSLDRVMMSVAILPMSAELMYSDTTKGLIAAAFTTGYFLCFLPAGIIAATLSPSTTLSVGLVVWSAAQAATPSAAYLGLTPLLACRALMGVGESCTFPSIQAIAARWVPTAWRSRFWGLLTACFNIGTIAAYSFSPSLSACVPRHTSTHAAPLIEFARRPPPRSLSPHGRTRMCLGLWRPCLHPGSPAAGMPLG